MHLPKRSASVRAANRSKKRKSTTSTRSSKRFSKVDSLESVEVEEEEVETCTTYNYREELTYLFFTSTLEHIIESREIIYEHASVIKNTPKLPPIVKDVQDPDSMPSKASKLKRHKSVIKRKCEFVCFLPASSEEPIDLINHGSALEREVRCPDVYKRDEASPGKGVKSLSKENTLQKSIISVVSLSEIERKLISKQSVMSIDTDRSITSLRDDSATMAKKKKKDTDWIIEPQDVVEKIIFKNGNIFEGETSRWLMHGRGVFLWTDRTFYKGEFRRGFPDGKGTMFLSDLSTYEGDFKRSLFDGVGSFRIASTEGIYKGSWKDGKKHGSGWYLYNQNNWYEGDWLEDKRHGEGFRRYSNGAKYKGMWCDNKKNGEGSMVWKNNDLYVGEWKDDNLNGYGEYTWNAIFTNLFLYPYCSWYKGSWVDGVRNGAGVMNFGTISGATLAGMWKNNQKHGPGVMICGNGLILQCNPLFVNDKPVHFNLVKQTLDTEDVEDEELEKENKEASTEADTEDIPDDTNAYRKVVRQIYTKIPLENFNHEILQMITLNGLKISKDRYIKLENSISHKTEMFRPLEIPLHTAAEDVDLKYFVDTMWDYYFPTGVENRKNSRKISKMSGEISTNFKYEEEFEESFYCSRDDEENLLRNLITGYLSNLMSIYHQYAIIMTGDRGLNCKVLLIRLFLWQLLRDIKLPHKGVSLTDVDEFIAKNPRCCLESDHSPFEVIYFWQFIQALVGCSWLLHLAKRRRNSCVTFVSGTISNIFRQFLEDHVFLNSGKFIGNSLTLYKDLVPIKGVYELYLKIGEPHSVKDFLYFTVPDQSEPLCFPAIDYGDKKPANINDGKNIIVGNKIMYLQGEEDFAARIFRNTKKETHADRFYKTLYIFRTLGKKNIIYSVYKICPNVVIRGKVNLDYKLTFLEFYEIVLLCTYEKAEMAKKVIYETKQDDTDTLKSSYQQSSTTSKLGPKKKKHK